MYIHHVAVVSSLNVHVNKVCFQFAITELCIPQNKAMMTHHWTGKLGWNIGTEM